MAKWITLHFLPYLLLLFHSNQEENGTKKGTHNFTRQIRQVIVSLKSIALAESYTGDILRGNTKRCIEVKLVVSQKEIFENVKDNVQAWIPQFMDFFKMSYVAAIYPQGYDWMKEYYRPCTTLKLFLDKILMDSDLIIYADTDIVFLRSVQHLWADFNKFKNETVAAMVPQLYRNKVKKINGYNPHAYNAGLILMNLTRMRTIDWTQRLGQISSVLMKDAKYADQDIIVAYFTKFPNQLQNLSCHWNFPPRNCGFGRKCARNGISAVHGVSTIFFSTRTGIMSFKSLFQAYEDLEFGNKVSLREFIHHLANCCFNSSIKRSFCDDPRNFANLVLKSIKRFSKFKG